ncbi:heavy-metal-associated domain-containing protein [Haemophilus parahaemolyticus]|uniref:heavy-metal-associated domain-containing protein n=1 Tax=Haemophilus parahaemolyticus TaxID=735 RepID=UPI00248F6479|nr:heavy-metal-associated domain-containing protein [Haemophilus parahaemolyticus]
MKSLLLAISLAFTTFFASQAIATEMTQTQSQHEVMLSVPEMNCQLCIYLVNRELRSIEGVISTKANMKERNVKVVAKPEVSNEQLIQAIEKLHYTAKVM